MGLQAANPIKTL